MFNSKNQTAVLVLALCCVAFGFQQQAAAAQLPKWLFPIPLGCDKCDDPNGSVVKVTIQQASNNRYVDAHVESGQDYRLVTRPQQKNDTQRWILKSLGNNRFTIQQASNDRYVDAHEHKGQDYRLVTRPRQKNDTQRWVIRPVD